MDEDSGNGSAELFDDGSIEIEFGYHNGDEAVLQSKTRYFFNSLLEIFRGAPEGAPFEAYLSPTQFEDSKVVRAVLACHFSRQPSSLP
jgi:hypothetical protein